MKSNSNKLRKFNANTSTGIIKKRRNAFNSNLVTNYELMLRLYLVNKEQASSGEGLKYLKWSKDKKAESTTTYLSIRDNIAQAISKVNHFIHVIRWPQIEIATRP